MLRILFTALFVLMASLLFAQQYKALDPVNPITFDGKHITYKGQKNLLDDNTFFVDGQLSDEFIAKHKFVFSSFNEAVKHLKDGTAAKPMTIYMAPYVYWIDNPDDPEIRMPEGNDRMPIGLHVNCNHLRIIGLTPNPVNVSLAANRGQSHGSKGNFTTFQFNGSHLYFENITFGNYCNVDLEFPLKPSLNRQKRSSAITQAQLAFVNGDCIEAHNCRFISRLNTCNLIGAKRTLFRNCHAECTDDAMASGVYLNCTFNFHSSKPWGSTRGTGAVLLNCNINIIGGQRQYFTKVQGPVAAIDCRYTASSNDVYIGWNQEPTDDFRGYQHNIRLNGKPITINADKPHVTVDMSNKAIADAYFFDLPGKRIYNIYNLLSGSDGWDPMQMKQDVENAEKQLGKKLHNLPVFLQIKPKNLDIETGVSTANLQAELLLFSGENVKNNAGYTWKIIDNHDFADIKPNNDACRVEGKNNSDIKKRVTVSVKLPDGLEAAALINVNPKMLEAPRFTILPQIIDHGKGIKRVEYALDLGERADMSEITWYRCKNKNGDNAIPVTVSRMNNLENLYTLSQADEGYYLMVSVKPKHIRSAFGEEKHAVSNLPIPANQAQIKKIYTDFKNFAAKQQPQIISGFWTMDNYRPELFHTDEKWNAPHDGNYWTFGSGHDGAKGVQGLMPTGKGARLLYTPVENTYADMAVSLTLAPCKSAGQGFGMAGQYMDIYIKFDTKTKTGYGLRIVRTVKSARAVDVVLMKYNGETATPISEAITTGCFRENCSISMRVAGNKFTAHAETSAKENHEFPGSVDLAANIEPNDFGGTGVHFTGTAGSNSTVFKNFKIEW